MIKLNLVLKLNIILEILYNIINIIYILFLMFF